MALTSSASLITQVELSDLFMIAIKVQHQRCWILDATHPTSNCRYENGCTKSFGLWTLDHIKPLMLNRGCQLGSLRHLPQISKQRLRQAAVPGRVAAAPH